MQKRYAVLYIAQYEACVPADESSLSHFCLPVSYFVFFFSVVRLAACAVVCCATRCLPHWSSDGRGVRDKDNQKEQGARKNMQHNIWYALWKFAVKHVVEVLQMRRCCIVSCNTEPMSVRGGCIVDAATQLPRLLLSRWCRVSSNARANKQQVLHKRTATSETLSTCQPKVS